MIEDLPSLKAATIGRCVSRAGEGDALAPNTLAADQPARDAILSSLCACQVTQHTGQYLIHRERLGALQSAHKVLMSVPIPWLDAKRPKLGFSRWSVGTIKHLWFSPHAGAWEPSINLSSFPPAAVEMAQGRTRSAPSTAWHSWLRIHQCRKPAPPVRVCVQLFKRRAKATQSQRNAVASYLASISFRHVVWHTSKLMLQSTHFNSKVYPCFSSILDTWI